MMAAIRKNVLLILIMWLMWLRFLELLMELGAMLMKEVMFAWLDLKGRKELKKVRWKWKWIRKGWPSMERNGNSRKAKKANNKDTKR